jgi:hypothetical protein
LTLGGEGVAHRQLFRKSNTLIVIPQLKRTII